MLIPAGQGQQLTPREGQVWAAAFALAAAKGQSARGCHNAADRAVVILRAAKSIDAGAGEVVPTYGL